MPRKSIVVREVDEKCTSMTLNFGDSNPINVVFKDFPKEIISAAVAEGFATRISRATSGKADPADARKTVEAVLANWKEGKWYVRGGSGGAGQISQLAHAIARIKKLDPKDVQAKLNEMSKEDKANIRAAADVEQEILKMKQEALRVKEPKEGETNALDAF